jgi:hypothetical protein
VTASVLHLLPLFGHGGGGRSALTAATVSSEHADRSPADADFEITRCTPPVGLGAGGLLDYGHRYPEDRLLAFWSGLYMAGNGQGALAAGLLSKAETLGFPSERVAPHLEEVMVS